MIVTMKQVAAKVGVSQMTISLYVHDPETNRISDQMKKKIQHAMADLNYVPSARSKTAGGRDIVGILLPFNMPIFKYELVDEYLNGIQQSLFAADYDFVFVKVQSKNDVPVLDDRTLMRCKSFRGIVLLGTRYSNYEDLVRALALLRRNKTPAVLLNYPKLVPKAIQGLTVDDRTCSPFDYLISLGHRRIAFVGGLPSSTHTVVLFDEYRSALERNGIPYDPSLVMNGGFEGYTAYRVLSDHLRQRLDFTALFCMSTQMVTGCYRAIKENGLSIPGDVSVINYGDPYFTEFLDPPLTAVHLPLSELSRECTDRLVDIIAQNISDVDQKIIKQNTLIVRQSTAVCAKRS